ncbi:helix-turn-helix domain-containing protein [Salinarimonas ramus]|uniref:Transcriptional regulator n=1 Tax=Salinarimonas ramus TaxID=690164 RepID=A0A917QBX0_9HYPH|nr:DNA-binding transcriptional regulator [Salinarimonas ramus]GGK42184.1 transcriptional regulator [Salinarimonas ramus]
MTKRPETTYRSDALAAIHETASDLHDAGVMAKRTMRRFDEMCLTPVKPLGAEEIRALRERECVSQAVFARHLNVTTGLVSQWERGEKTPVGPSLKLLTLVRARGLDAIA